MTDVSLWRQFRGLLPQAPLIVAEVVSHDTDGTSLVELPGGQQFKARGQTVAVGDWAYIRDGEIRGEAPALTLGLDLEV